MRKVLHGAMRLSFSPVVLHFFLIFAAIFLCAGDAVKAQTSPAQASRVPVVLELFTSEGCSSCPPADALLQKLQAHQPIAGVEIIALEEHVDYWNHDGWEDPYSSPEWTQRQEDYAARFKNDPYTPELVVDGRNQFVGNNEREAEQEIEKAAKSAKAYVAIQVEKPDATGSQHFSVSVGKLDDNAGGDVAEVWLALTEDGLHSSVNRGENAGRLLQHVATLRWLRKIGVADTGGTDAWFRAEPVVKLNSHWDVERLRATVFVQKKKSREILGAASTKIEVRQTAERQMRN